MSDPFSNKIILFSGEKYLVTFRNGSLGERQVFHFLRDDESIVIVDDPKLCSEIIHAADVDETESVSKKLDDTALNVRIRGMDISMTGKNVTEVYPSFGGSYPILVGLERRSDGSFRMTSRADHIKGRWALDFAYVDNEWDAYREIYYHAAAFVAKHMENDDLPDYVEDEEFFSASEFHGARGTLRLYLDIFLDRCDPRATDIFRVSVEKTFNAEKRDAGFPIQLEALISAHDLFLRMDLEDVRNMKYPNRKKKGDKIDIHIPYGTKAPVEYIKGNSTTILDREFCEAIPLDDEEGCIICLIDGNTYYSTDDDHLSLGDYIHYAFYDRFVRNTPNYEFELHDLDHITDTIEKIDAMFGLNHSPYTNDWLTNFFRSEAKNLMLLEE